ncbi:hypothetical protein [Rhizobium sp. SGZ-381]|uniref:hypothetical protein n=1 Tax=Rhizobium sp. SGZ-381 TaxID=3342800 RepID=UPI0036721769
MRRLALASLLLVGAAASASGRDLPADVSAFVAKREQCDHFREEPPGDAARRQEIAAALEASCRGTDARLKALKQKYRSGPVRALLDGFEAQIE